MTSLSVAIILLLHLLAAASVTQAVRRAVGQSAPPIQTRASSESWVLFAEWTGTVPPSTSWVLSPRLQIPAGKVTFLLGGALTAGVGLISLQCAEPGQVVKTYTQTTYALQVTWKISNNSQCSVTILNMQSRANLSTSFTLMATYSDAGR